MERKVLVKISAALSVALGLLGAVWYVAALKKQQVVVAQPAVVMVLDSLLQQVLDAPASEGRGLMQKADSVYYSLSSPGITIACKRYDTKRAWFMERAFIADTALLYADSTLRLLQKAPVKEWYYQQYVEAVLNKGDILLYQGKYYDAFRCYYDGKQAINKVRDTCLYKSFVAAYSGRVAMVNYRRFKYREAIGWFKESVDNLYGCDKKIAAFAAMQGTLDNIALAYTRLQMADSALYYYQAALHFIETHEQAYPDKTAFIEMAKAVIYGNEGDALLLKGDTTGARVLFTRSIVINSKEGYYNADAVITRIKLAEVYCWQHELQKAGEVMEEVRVRETIIPGDDIRARWLRLNWKYYHDKGQPVLANAYLQRYFAFKDSVDVSRVALNEADFGKTYEALDHAYAFKVLNEKYRLKTEYLLVAILAMVMAVAVVMVLLYARRLARKNLAHINLQNQQLETAMAELELSNKNYSHLLKIVAHDLRNPIGAMGSIAALLANNSNSSRERNMLELIQTSSRQSLDMITDLMEINFSNERLAVTRKEFEMNQLVHQCVDLLSFKAREKGLQLLIKTEVFALVSADYYKIWRVINNLLMNAIKFSAVNGTIVINLVLKGERVQLSVQDSGQGIPEDIRDKVFDLFTEAKRPGTLGEQPYGMGLYISRQIMEAHDGSIWFECIEGRGTIFYITLPLSAK